MGFVWKWVSMELDPTKLITCFQRDKVYMLSLAYGTMKFISTLLFLMGDVENMSLENVRSLQPVDTKSYNITSTGWEDAIIFNINQNMKTLIFKGNLYSLKMMWFCHLQFPHK